MSRNSRRNRKNGVYWQTAGYNAIMFQAFRTQIINMALSRFKWVNLPPTCDERFLEWTLLLNGMATIAHPKKRKGTFYSTQATQLGAFNVYDNPVEWQSFGNGGWRFNVTPANGVLVYDNLAREPLLPILECYARELVDVMATKRMNRQHQKIPFILTGSQDQKLDMLNLYKQVDGGEPAVIATNSLSSIGFNALQTGVEYIGDELQAEFLNIWNMIYTALGIDNQPFKAERQIEDEVISATMPSNMMALSPLEARRDACRKLNERFEPFLSNPLDVVWRKDNQSEDYDLATSISARAKAVNR